MKRSELQQPILQTREFLPKSFAETAISPAKKFLRKPVAQPDERLSAEAFFNDPNRSCAREPESDKTFQF